MCVINAFISKSIFNLYSIVSATRITIGQLGDNEAIHTIIYYTKMYRLQSYNYITTCVILKQFRLTFNSLGKVNIMQNIAIIRHNTLRAEYITCS